MAKDVYLPLMMGDWIRGTRGMKAEVKGVYIGLLIHQYDEGYIPSDIETLSLIEPEVGKVWVFLKDKFKEIAPGKLQNEKLEEVRNFWQKQRNNGKKGGRPKDVKPKLNPNDNPNNNLHIDYDYDSDLNINKKSKLEIFQTLFGDDIFIEQLNRTHKGKDLKQAFEECYTHHSNAPNPPQELWEWKQKLNTWLTIKKPENGTSKKEQQNRSNISAFAARVIERNKGQ